MSAPQSKGRSSSVGAGVRGAQAHLDAGVVRVEVEQPGDQPFDGEGAEAGHVQRAFVGVAQAAHRLMDLLEGLGERGLQGARRCGERGAGLGAREQRQAQVLLQLPYLAADGAG